MHASTYVEEEDQLFEATKQEVNRVGRRRLELERKKLLLQELQ